VEKLVKPLIVENPRQSCTIAWRMSYAQSAILERERKKPGHMAGFFSVKLTGISNSFVWTILAVNHLE
jgi:hypothetical protein